MYLNCQIKKTTSYFFLHNNSTKKKKKKNFYVVFVAIYTLRMLMVSNTDSNLSIKVYAAYQILKIVFFQVWYHMRKLSYGCTFVLEG